MVGGFQWKPRHAKMIKRKAEQQLAKPMVVQGYSQLPPARTNIVTTAASQDASNAETAKMNFNTISDRSDSFSWPFPSGSFTHL
jgi:hypothetical protein